MRLSVRSWVRLLLYPREETLAVEAKTPIRRQLECSAKDEAGVTAGNTGSNFARISGGAGGAARLKRKRPAECRRSEVDAVVTLRATGLRFVIAMRAMTVRRS